MFAIWDGFTDYLHGFLFGIYPYICLGVFVIGSLIRFDRDQYTWRSGSSQMLRARQLRLGSNLFHFGIIFLFFGHFIGLLTPHWAYEWAIAALPEAAGGDHRRRHRGRGLLRRPDHPAASPAVRRTHPPHLDLRGHLHPAAAVGAAVPRPRSRCPSPSGTRTAR